MHIDRDLLRQSLGYKLKPGWKRRHHKWNAVKAAAELGLCGALWYEGGGQGLALSLLVIAWAEGGGLIKDYQARRRQKAAGSPVMGTEGLACPGGSCDLG